MDGARRRIAQIAGSVAIVAGITFVDHLLPHLNHTTITLTHLMGVLGIAAKWGLLEAVVASVAAIGAEAYFFLAPIHDFAIEDPQNWVAVSAFFVVSVVAGQLSAGARNRAREAIERQRELELLYSLSQSILTRTDEEAGQSIVDATRTVFSFDYCELCDTTNGTAFHSGQPVATLPPGAMIPVQAGDVSFGEIGWTGGTVLSLQASQSVAHLVAVALDRSRTQAAAAHAEAIRQGQEIKALLMDSVAHEFKTPLTSIRLGATVLQEAGTLKPAHNEVVTVIVEEAERLDAMISEAIQTAGLEAGSVQLNLCHVAVADLLTRAVGRVRTRWTENRLDIQLPLHLPSVEVDPALFSIALTHLVDNACKYSPRGTVQIQAWAAGGSLFIAVNDHGPGIPPNERARVFDRFYRRDKDKGVPGSGTGLAIASDIVRLHAGEIQVEGRPAGGSCFRVRIPLPPRVSA